MSSPTDPRKYAVIYPKENSIINQALLVVDEPFEAHNTALLAGIIKQALIQENDALINVALNLAPNVAISRLIWQTLNQVINSAESTKLAENISEIFAIPIILVAGSKTSVTLPGVIDLAKLNNFFIANGVFPAINQEVNISDTVSEDTNADTVFVSAKLIAPKSIAALKPSQIYYWVRNISNAQLWLPWEVDGSAIQIMNEGVFLRFLIGVNTSGKPLGLAKFNASKMQLMQLLLTELKVQDANVTLFPIPGEVVPLSQAFTHGENLRTEIAFQVALSNVVKTIRSQGQEPYAIITTQEEALKVMIMSDEHTSAQEVSLWHLRKFDDFQAVLNTIQDLLQAIGVQWKVTI